MPEEFLLPIPVSGKAYSAASSRSFKLPPLDGSLTLPEIYDWHFENNSRHTVFMYESVGGVGYTHLSYAEIVPAAHKAAKHVAANIGLDLDLLQQDTGVSPVAAIFGPDTIAGFCTILGMIRVGIPIFNISPHISPASVARLLQRSGAEHLLISSDASLQELVRRSQTEDFPSNIKISVLPTFGEIFSDDPHVPLKPIVYDLEGPVVLTHSSGSTSLPKTIPCTHPFLLQCGVAPLYGSHNYCNEIFAWHTVSMNHGTGIHLLAWLPLTGMIVAVLPPCLPSLPTSAALLKSFARLKADYLVTFPKYLEDWSCSGDNIELLKLAKAVIFVGGFLNLTIGDLLATKGVRLHPLFGMAEAGVIGSFLPLNQGLDWEYFPLTPHSGGQFIDAGDNFYELVIVKSATKHLQVINTTFGSNEAYRSYDLFLEHPEKPGFWKVVGRMSDRITHANGKKIDTVPFEHAMSSDPQIRGAVVFGDQKDRCGLLVELRDDFYFDPENKDMFCKFQEYIRLKLEEVNCQMPNYSQIYPDMVLTASKSKPFQYTEKGSLRKSEALRMYQAEIESMYSRIEGA